MKIKDFSNAGLWLRFRFWLIQKIAGRATVVLNARLSLTVPPPGYKLVIDNLPHGFLCVYNDFRVEMGERVLKIESSKA